MNHEVDYKTLVETVPDHVIQVDLEGKILYINHTVPGLEPKSVVGTSVFDYIPPESQHIQRDAFKRVLETGESTEYELKGVGPNGSEAYYRSRIGPVRNGDRITGFTYVTSDITDQKKAQNAVKHSESQLRILSQRLVEAQEEERSRISLEIHDELGQLLTALKIDIDWLKSQSRDCDEVKKRFRGTRDIVSLAIDRVRRISSELRPGILDDLGLPAALEWQREEFEKRTGVLVALTIDPPELEVHRDVATAFFRILQEALTNIARHAKATAAHVSLQKIDERKMISLEISDNGVGFDAEAKKSNRSIGLFSIRERVQALSGKLEVDSTAGNGTTLIVSIPLKTDSV